MSTRRTIGVVIGAGPASTISEALRAAVGLTLRGDRVEVAIAAEALTAVGSDGARAAATLALFEHPVRIVGRDADATTPALAADVVELWGDAAPASAPVATGPRPRLHLLRPGHRVAIAAPRDRVLHLPAPAAGAATIDDDDDDHHDLLLDAILDADVVLVW